MEIKITRSELYKLPIFIGSNSAICRICGVGSNIYPSYDEGEGAAVIHRLSYCGHTLETDTALMMVSLPHWFERQVREREER